MFAICRCSAINRTATFKTGKTKFSVELGRTPLLPLAELGEVPDAQLVIVGEGNDVIRLKGLVDQLGIGRSVLFTGRVDDPTLDGIYERAALFALPSRAEGFGIVYLEAMSHRLACIGSIHDAAGEIVVHGETGFLVNQDDVSDLAAKVVDLLRDSNLRQRFGQNGYDRLQAKFSCNRFEDRMAGLLDKLAAG